MLNCTEFEMHIVSQNLKGDYVTLTNSNDHRLDYCQ